MCVGGGGGEGGYKCILQYVLLLHALLQVLNVVIAMHYGMMFSFLKLVVGPAAVHINLQVRIIQLHLLYVYNIYQLDCHDENSFCGLELREEVEKKFEKWVEPPPVKQPKPLPRPDDPIKKRRGGRR